MKAIFHPAIPVVHLIFTFGYLQTDLEPWRPSTILEPVMRLEREGVHVAYGIVGLKIHSKTCMVVREEGDETREDKIKKDEDVLPGEDGVDFTLRPAGGITGLAGARAAAMAASFMRFSN